MISGISTPVLQSYAPATRPAGPQQAFALSEEEKTQLEQLKKTDREVRAHEQAHKSAGGPHAGSASFAYAVGPDGQRYAVSGEVPIDMAPIDGDPEATIEKMNMVIAAALAPARPSGQDRSVAARAASIRADAQIESSRKADDGDQPVAAAGQSDAVQQAPDESGPISPEYSVAQTAYQASATARVAENIPGAFLNLSS